MKKLYLLLVSSVLLVGGAGALVVSVAGCGEAKTPPIKSVNDYLSECDYRHPLFVSYLKNMIAGGLETAKTMIDTHLRSSLRIRNSKIFTELIVDQINFKDETSLKPGSRLKIQAIYNGKSVSMWVEEGEKPDTEQVMQALQYFNSKDHPVEIDAKYQYQYADVDRGSLDLASNAMRHYLIAHDTTKAINSSNANFIEFAHNCLYLGAPFRVMAYYHYKPTPIFVKLLPSPSLLVDNALRKFSKPNLRLKIQESQKEVDSGHSLVIADNPFGTKKIRDALVAQGGLSRDLAQQINFGDTLIARGTYDEKAHRAVPDSGRKWHTTAKFGKNVKIEIFGSTNL